jgi:pimeloyl-ACP methyl ester carboxylesterase
MKASLPKPAVVLVHGLWMTPLFMAAIARHLRAQGYVVYSFSYSPTRQSFSSILNQFNDFVLSVYLSHPQLHFVGHSLGGRLLLAWISRFAPRPSGRVVTLASPHQGSVLARHLESYYFAPVIFGRALTMLMEEGDGMVDGWQLGVIAGSRPLGLGRLFRVHQDLNDGAVAVSETRLPGMADHCVLPLSHSGMLFSSQTSEQVSHFLQHGRFSSAS